MCLACRICMPFFRSVCCFLQMCLARRKCMFLYQMSIACWKCVLLVTNVFFIKCLLLAGSVSCLSQMYFFIKCLLLAGKLVTNVFFIKCLLLAGNVSCLLQMYDL